MVSVLFHQRACDKRRKSPEPRAFPWYVKTEVTFSDALAAVRRQFWVETVFSESLPHEGLNKLPPKIRRTLLDHLSLAA